MTRHRSPVTPQLRADVFARDKGCVLARMDSRHVCRDRWGRTHGPDVLHLLTIEHVHEGYGMAGVRAPSDLEHCVALCHGTNVKPPSRDERTLMRAYLGAVSGVGASAAHLDDMEGVAD